MLMPLLWLLGLLVLTALVAAPIAFPILFRRLGRAEAELRELRQRLLRLEWEASRAAAAPEPLAPPSTPAAEPLAPPAASPTALAEPPIPAPVASALPPPPMSPPPLTPAPAQRPLDAGSFEDLIGSVWFQNIGAVLILVGAFFLILWGYTTGRFGPGVLVGAGIAVGLTISWRGDRLVRTVPRFGQALIGLGFGIVYLSLFLGHFTLRVMPSWAAFIALLATSFVTLVAGLRHRAQTIAALGVIGAFLPQYLVGLLGLHGFTMSPGGMLGYLAAVNAVVFALAARAGWSGLDFSALLLSAALWVFQFGDKPGSWPITIGLGTLFTAFGFAPLPRLVRVEGRVKPSDLAVIVVAPLAFVACAWPTLAYASPTDVAMLLAAMAAAQLAAALWVDSQRPERDLWRPLTGSATLFLTAALQRAVGTEHTPMAWTLEGVLLIWLGLGRGGSWLRACGFVVAVMGSMWLIFDQILGGPHVWWNSVRDLGCIAALMFVAQRLHARRAELTESEQPVPELWLAIANVSLVLWLRGEMQFLAQGLEGAGGFWHRLPNLAAPAGRIREIALTHALIGAAWLLQAGVLILIGLRGRRFVRAMGHFIAGLAAIEAGLVLLGNDGWGRDVMPILHAPGLFTLLMIAGAIVIARRLAHAHDTDQPGAVRSSHLWGSMITLVMMIWVWREADHVARALFDVPGPNAQSIPAGIAARIGQAERLGRVLASAGWLAQALIALAVGWVSGSRFVRWLGLGLAAITAIKFVFADLAAADPFWRFLSAIVLGSALLLVSFAYQRRKRVVPTTS
jgi:uncharacterized membrane protein